MKEVSHVEINWKKMTPALIGLVIAITIIVLIYISGAKPGLS